MNSFLNRIRFLPVAAILLIVASGQTAFSQQLFNLNPLDQGDDQQPAFTIKAWFTTSSPNEGTVHVQAITTGKHYIYGVDQPEGDGPIPTRVTIKPSGDYKVGDFRPLKPPKKAYSDAFEADILTQKGTITWVAPIQFSGGVSPETVTLSGQIYAQACTKEYCMPPKNYPFTAKKGEKVLPEAATAGKPATPPKAAVDESPAGEPVSVLPSPMKKPADDTTPTPDESSGKAKQAPPIDFTPTELEFEDGTTSNSLTWILLVAFLGGLLLNLMPCVLPVIGLKVLSFVEQSGHSFHKAFMLNAWYSLGLLSVFWVLASLAAFLGFGWGQLFTYAEFNIALAAIVFVMGLSFLGVWELPIPGFVGSGHMAELGEKEGATGAFIKGVITTILATPCTAPFLGTALAWAVTRPPVEIYLVFTAVGLGMAFPYLMIGAFPRLTTIIPKAGAWMETFKQLLGFVLLGTVVYLLTILRWYYMVPTVGFLFGLWAACWWIGRTPITATSGAKAVRWLQSGIFAAVIWVLMFPGTIAAFDSLGLPLGFRGLAGIMQDRLEKQSELWVPFTMEAFTSEIADGKTVIIDFTADWCLVCKTLEATVLETEAVEAAVIMNNIATFKADWTHGEPEVTRMLENLGAKQVPVVAVFPARDPMRPIVLRGGFTTTTILNAIDKAVSEPAEKESTPL